ncbi:type I toxin-antitoxin system Ibs family toxin [Escherichia coli]|nr:type I toxin-antitoxin system Ibs family toxin [Escherichia coli]EFD9215924.1 type I toxin-antitoxin system Ibs family toxin [Escherichia coli]EHK7251825.1 type I toxin-antitoxin system Ibs family toxin [Escherichia coli]EIV9368470.1 type I toxin-antitoxin system Ibs family toxin [Escherichia coli]HBC1743196.1 type I toxin-antitoxin system Ibs family toxin [Escherichia coli]HCO2368936.1 type I toxin-antitoxin system Ibs family toxin [Escherichia coli]
MMKILIIVVLLVIRYPAY